MITVGDKVKVKAIRDRGQTQPLVGKEGVVREFRVVDGSQVGYVVTFTDETSQWFFANELEPA